MARTLGSLLGVSKQTEMLVMTIMTLWANIFDMTLFELGTNLEQVWNVPLEITKFSPEIQNLIKILLSGVVFVRTFSLHLYIAFLIAMFWPATFGTRPTLMLPWLTVSAVKNIGAGIVTFATGLYTCLMYGPMRPACLRFFGSQILDMSPSFYMWIVGISLYRDLRQPLPLDKAALKLTEEEELNVALRRRKVKSMVDENILRKQFESRRKFIGTSAVEVKEIFSPVSFEENLISRKISRSLDSLLDAMNAEAEIMESEDFEPLEEWLNIPEKTAKLLGVTMSEISRIKQNKQTYQDLPLYPVTPQKKQANISSAILKHESPRKLLPETSLYTPSAKPVRPTKSELKSPKDFLKLKSPSDFMQFVPESELRSCNYTTTDQKRSSIYTTPDQNSSPCTTEIIFQQPQSEPEPEPEPQLQIITNKRSHEIGCQVSTLSKRILNAPVKEITDKLSKIPKVKHSKSRTISIRPPPDSKTISIQPPTDSKTAPIRAPPEPIPKRCGAKPPSGNSQKRVSNHNLSGKKNAPSISPREENTYLGMHLQKLGRDKITDNYNKIGVDKFGVVSTNPTSEVGSKGLGFNECESDVMLEKTFENITFQF